MIPPGHGNSPPDPASLQFERAEYVAGSPGPVCCTCQQPATPEYHQFRGRMFCTNCRLQIEQSMLRLRESGSLARAFVYGLGAAALGSLLFYAVSAITGYQLGLIAVVVGWLVGKAVRKGSASVGGLPYQALAVSLTYISIVSSYIPGLLQGLSQRAGEAPAQAVHTGATSFYLYVFLLALAAPLLAGFRNILGIIIIGIGLWEAWKFNRRVDVQFTGPFSAAGAR